MAVFWTDEGHPSWFTRLLIGLLGSAVPLVGPFILKFTAYAGAESVTAAARAGTIGALVVMGLAWAISVLITAVSHEDHVMKCVMASLGFPGLVISMGIGIQAYQ
ncbi:MAG TPA: hypothetical protein VMU06_16645 [Stellaceae bacterium]|nr:hypothetical protein [Stellaceae bacterium]